MGPVAEHTVGVDRGTRRKRMNEQGPEPRPPFGIAEVNGPSMYPTLKHGDRLLVHYGAGIKPGDVAVLRHPLQQDLLIVKRLVELRDGGWWVLGDNPGAEGDSRLFGTVPPELLLGRVRGRYRPLPADQRSVRGAVSWALSAVRLVLSDRSVSRRLRAR
ncbi:nickel-type superoxide dismutase maturation protease [Streptomyces sp. NPDC051907]|uniref:nickel-type superoxide dismutase maturation protease n=1 Tax=Streptomyces sp. NPDC051907 TaxID=3155284 RepID=UPI003445ECE8